MKLIPVFQGIDISILAYGGVFVIVAACIAIGKIRSYLRK